MQRRGFPRSIRLRRRADFLRVQGGRRRVHRHDIVVCWQPRPLAGPRFGLTVSRKVGGAVVRNQVKRWLREAIRHERGDLSGVDIVFIARSSAAMAGYEPLRREVASTLRQIEAQARPLRHGAGLDG